MISLNFVAELWEYGGDGSWHFLTLPKEYSEDIKSIASGARRGFGSVPVRATIKGSSWNTSIFPDSKIGSYLLPVKKEIRQKCGLQAGKATEVTIDLIEY